MNIRYIFLYTLLKTSLVFSAGPIPVNPLNCAVDTFSTYIHSSKSASASRITKESIKNRLGKYDIADPTTNRRFMNIKDGKSDIDPLLYLDAENAILKQLNDNILKDKELVTALLNKYKLILKDEVLLNPILKKYIVGGYSDFKSVRMAFADKNLIAKELGLAKKIGSDLESEYVQKIELIKKEIKNAFYSTGKKFEKYLDKTEVTIPHKTSGIAASPSKWHLGGIWDSADKASLANRMARKLKVGQDTLSDGFKLEKVVEKNLNQIEDLRKSIASQLKNKHAGLLDETPSGKLILSEKTSELIRKIKAPENANDAFLGALKTRIKQRYQLDLSKSQVQEIKDYYFMSDIYSPAIYIEKRVILPIEKASHGVLSADIKGLGAKNAFETQAALADNHGKSLNEVLNATRQGELNATKQLMDKGELFDKSIEAFEKSLRIKESKKAMKEAKEAAKKLRNKVYDTDEAREAAFKQAKALEDEAEKLNRLARTGDDKHYYPPRILSLEEYETYLKDYYTEFMPSTQNLPDFRMVYSYEKLPSGKIKLVQIDKAESFEKSFRQSIEAVDYDIYQKMEHTYTALYHKGNDEYTLLIKKDAFNEAELLKLFTLFQSYAEKNLNIKVNELKPL